MNPTLTQQLATVVAIYHSQAIAAAEAEAEYKKQRAKRKLTAKHSGEATSDAACDTIADADDMVADLFSKRLITAAIADSTRQKINSLREEIGMARSQMASEREMDRIHSTDRGAT